MRGTDTDGTPDVGPWASFGTRLREKSLKRLDRAGVAGVGLKL